MFEKRKLQRQKTLFEINQYKKANQLLESLLPSFARDNDEDEWKALSGGKEVYSEQDLAAMQKQASGLCYKNSLALGIIETLISFTIGKVCRIIALDENPDVQEYWDAFYEVNDFDSKSKEMVRRTLRDGECFIRFFPPKSGDVQKIRFVEPSEIKPGVGGKPTHGIETDPDDVEEVVSYHREYVQSDNVAMKEDIPADEMLHLKIRVDSNVKRGISFLVGIAEYIVKYKDWLDDRIVLNKIRSMFGLIGKVTGGSSLSNLSSKLPDSTTNKNTNSGDYKKKLFKRGSVLLTKGVEWDFKHLNIAASDTKDDGRAILLMIVAGTNLAEYMVTGDASNAAYASTMVSESPAVKAFESWQDFFEKPFKKIYKKVIEYGIERGPLSENSKKTIPDGFDKKTGVEKFEDKPIPTNKECQVDYPILIHRNIKDETEALQVQKSNGWVSSRTASGKLGYDYKEEQKQIEIEEMKQMSAEKEKTPEKINSGEE